MHRIKNGLGRKEVVWVLLLTLLMASCGRIQARVEADKGYRAYLNKEFSTAIAHYKKAYEQDPNSETIMRNLGYSYLGRARELTSSGEAIGYYRSATAVLSKLLALEPNERELSGVLLDAWTQGDQLSDAALFFSEQVSKSPKDPEPLRLLSMIELRRGNFQSALNAYEQRQKLAPNDAQLYAAKATLCWEWLRSGGVHDPEFGVRLATMGLESALEAERLIPNHPSALVYAGLLLRERSTRQKDPKEAAKDLMTAQKYLEQIRARKPAGSGT